jgi:predicted nucleic acid-binding protein
MDATTPVVVDTDVVSFLFKSHSLAPAYQATLAARSLAASLISLAEIEYGMEVNYSSKRTTHRGWQGILRVRLNVPQRVHWAD